MPAIDVMVIELTNKCDLNCKFCPNNKNYNLDFDLFGYILKENEKLENPVKRFELSGMGNPLLYDNILEILKLLHHYNRAVTIITNGNKLKDIIAYFDDSILQNVHFCIYLDSPYEEKNNHLMGIEAFNKTIESLEYLSDRNLRYDIIMRMNSQNFNEMEDMLEICKHYRCNLFIPMEIFPFGKANELILNDEMKTQVINTVNWMKYSGELIHKVIHFETPENNCTYLRKKRIFINSRGMLSFCHFLSSLHDTEIIDIRNKTLAEVIEIDNKIRNEFLRKKENEIKSWNHPRETVSPCSYCLHCYGGNQKW